MEEVHRLEPTSPHGQKRKLVIDHPLVYRVRVSNYRGATWVDDVHKIVWLCATRRRKEASDKDAYRYFEHLHEQGTLLATADDYLRDRAEAAIRLQRGLTAELLGLVDQALVTPGNEYQQDLGDWPPCRVLVAGEWRGAEDLVRHGRAGCRWGGCQAAASRPTLRRPRAIRCSSALRAAHRLADWTRELG